MNKQEALKRIEAQKETLIRLTGWAVYVYIKELIKSLDEPKKVVVPQFVADWISYAKGWNKTLHYALENSPEKVNLWLCEDELNRQNVFARAWLDGYEVEKEKRYLVKFKGFNPSYIILKYHPYDKTWFLGREQEYNFFRQRHTRKELEDADFGWVFDCPGIEVEEVD
mgnify:CR=1 FL=1